jgi:phenylalanyl-tRNA synthetase beta chain
VDVTPNRGDLLSHWGVARELAPNGQTDLQAPAGAELSYTERAGPIAISIAEPLSCARYIGVSIEGVKVGPAPEWLAARLRAIGARPINNIVDATNYVLHELGQPLHAFDQDRLAQQQIIVRRAHANEKLTTLDGEERELAADMLVIADGARATAIAGVMGGLDSEVTNETTNVLLECGWFEPRQVRRTRTALGMSTDASYRFERGVDPTMMQRAVSRAVQLILDSAGGRVAGAADVNAQPVEPRTIRVRTARVKQVLGQEFATEDIGALLGPIGFEVSRGGDVKVPGHLLFDVEREIDVVEEIARRYGYNNFPSELLPFRPSAVPDDALARLENRLRELLVGRGFLEARTAAFAPETEGDVELLLPLSSAESRLRRALLPGLLRRLEYNLNRGTRNVRLFEIGTAFATGATLPRETTRVALIFTGLRAPPHWTGGAAEYDIWDAKALVRELADALGIAEIAPAAAGLVTAGFAGRRDDIEIMGGRLDSSYIDAPAWAGEFFGIEAVLPTGGYEPGRTAYEPLAQHPPTEQDLALVVPEALASDVIEATIRKAGGVYLEDVHAFDLYRGPAVPAGHRSIAYRLRFRAGERTLTDAEADDAVRKILNRLKDDHAVERRG